MNKTKQLASAFIKENKLYSANFSALNLSAENIGYTIIEFSKTFNNNDVNVIVEKLKLNEYIQKSNGFTFANNKYRLIFINKDLSEKEKAVVIAHELGHIICKHFGTNPIIGQDVLEEYEANEFAHYLLHNGLNKRTYVFVSIHKKSAAVFLILVAFIVVAVPATMFIKKQQSYYGEYYITDTGQKYHKKECIFVKDKKNVRRITKEEFESDEYKSCEICLPNK